MFDNFWAIFGALAFGSFVGVVVRYFLERFDHYGVKELGAILSAPVGGTLLVFLNSGDFGPHAKSSYTMGLVLGLVLYQGFHWKFPALPMRVKRHSPITILEAENRLILKDKLGHDSRWIRTQKMRFNEESDRALITQLIGDGGFNIVGLVADRAVKRDSQIRGGVSYVYAQFSTPVKKHQVVSVTLTIDWTDSFCTSNEAIEHTVLMETDKISFVVEFPGDRLSNVQEMSRSFGAFTDGLPGPTVQGNTVTGAVEAKIGIAETYRLSWNW